MNARNETDYRLRLAEGFLAEAIQDEGLQRWRSCVDNSQLAVENAGKAALSVFGISPKTHDPARQLAVVLEQIELTSDVRNLLKQMMPELQALGSSAHFLTDYGDEQGYVSPWELFGQESAVKALASARKTVKSAKHLISGQSHTQ